MLKRRLRIILVSAITVSALAILLVWAGWRLGNSRSYQLFGHLLTRVKTTDSVVALTLDDGPLPIFTDSVLGILADSNVHATFFVVGAALAEHAELGRRIVSAGHELGNHSYSHHRLVFKTPGYVRHEVEATDSLITAAGQGNPPYFRPPYGKRLVILPWILSRAGRTTVLWDLEPDTYPRIARDPARIVEYVMARVRPGSIILLHTETAPRGPAREALPALIGRLKAAGYTFATISELARHAQRS